MNPNLALLYTGALCIGIVAGLRSLTAPAVTGWAVRLGWLDLTGFRLAWLGSNAAAIVLSLLAALELVVDKRPTTPSRTETVPFGARLFTGALCALVIFASAHQPLVLGAALGAIGAAIGTFGGFKIRSYLVKDKGLPDLWVALAEDLVAVGGGFLLVSHLF